MKKIILMVIAMVMTVAITNVAMAQKKSEPKKITKTEFITNIDCDHCVQKVMKSIPYQKGVEDVDVDLRKKIVTVTYDADKTDDKTLIKAFTKIKVKASVYDPKPAAKTLTPVKK